jgi:hypothetical protein
VISISVQPSDGVITTGPEYTVQFTAIGYRADGSTVDVTNSVAWTSSDTTIATVNSDGKASTVTDGVVTISASLSSLSGSTSLTASSEPLLSIAVFADTDTPNVLSVSACKNLQLKAIGTYADGVRDIIPITDYVTWSIDVGNGQFSENDNEQGLLNTYSDGTIGVKASLGIESPATDVNVTADLSTISISPLSQTIRLDGKQQYTAIGTYNDSSTADITDNLQWLSDPATVADFNNSENGLITALALGSTSVTAACGTVVSANAASLTVSDLTLDYLRFEGPTSNEILAFTTVVGEVSQISLRAYYTNGTDDDVTKDAEWSLLEGTPTGIIAVNNSTDKGRITALAVGQANVRVVYQQREKVLQVTVNSL